MEVEYNDFAAQEQGDIKNYNNCKDIIKIETQKEKKKKAKKKQERKRSNTKQNSIRNTRF